MSESVHRVLRPYYEVLCTQLQLEVEVEVEVESGRLTNRDLYIVPPNASLVVAHVLCTDSYAFLSKIRYHKSSHTQPLVYLLGSETSYLPLLASLYTAVGAKLITSALSEANEAGLWGYSN